MKSVKIQNLNRRLGTEGKNFSTVRSVLRLVTSQARALPDFIIIGAQKCGTTSLYYYLCQHPTITNAAKKELHYFERAEIKPLRLYKAAFPLRIRNKGKITGEASPEYLFHPWAAKNINKILSKIKLIAILREPAERAWSHWRHNIRRGVESLDFHDALNLEEKRIGGDYQKMQSDPNYIGLKAYQYSYKFRGKYYNQLKRYYDIFDKDKILILKSDDLKKYPQKSLDRCFKFLGLQSYVVNDLINKNADPLKKKPVILEDLKESFSDSNRRLFHLLDTKSWW